MKSAATAKKTQLRLAREDDDYVSPDDLRVIITQLKECWQLGDNNVMREARHALLAVLRKSAKRLTRDYNHSGNP